MNRPNNSSLIIAYYFHQLFPAIAAVTYYRQLHALDVQDRVLIHILNITKEEKQLVLQAFPWIEFLADYIPTHRILNEKSSKSSQENVRLIKIALNRIMPIVVGAKILQAYYTANFFNAIYFPHDVTSDFTAQSFMQAFPSAKRICYGDTLGNLIDRTNFEKHLYQNKETWRDTFALFNRRLKQLGCRWLTMQMAMLMIPVGFSKNCFETVSLEIIPKQHALNILKKLQEKIERFNNYIDELCEKTDSPSYLFLLGHLAQAGITTLKNEFLLYREILQTQLPKNATLILKAHPGGNFEELKHLAEWARQQGHPTFIFSESFLHLPIEFAEKLIKKCQVLSISYASISLSYLYGASVKHVLNNELIDKYCLASRKDFMQHYDEIYQQVQKNLLHWDGKEPLFCEDR